MAETFAVEPAQLTAGGCTTAAAMVADRAKLAHTGHDVAAPAEA